jgi:hypothetical protein
MYERVIAEWDADAAPAIDEFQLLHATHNADHSELTDDQRLAVQHYREALIRLQRKQAGFDEFVDGLPLTPMGLARRTTPRQQDTIFEMTSGFFDQVYSTLSALASVHSRLRPLPGFREPPTRTNEKFLKWWTEVISSRSGLSALQILLDARDYRTLNAHPQQFAVFDWQTIAFGSREMRVLLTGRQSSTGNVPEGAERLARDTTRWIMLAPSMREVVRAFHTLTVYTFGALPSLYPLDEDDEFCAWEPDGHGSGPGVDVAEAVQQLLAGLDDEDAWRLLAPSITSDLQRYIDQMKELRRRSEVAAQRRRARSMLP